MCKNKSVAIVICFLVLICIQLTLSPITFGNNYEKSATFPMSLQRIDNDAFSGTSFQTLAFQKGLLYIGEHAFWNCDIQIVVYVPESVIYIGDNAFPENAVVHGLRDSYAEEWARNNKYQFIEESIWPIRRTPKRIHAEWLLIWSCLIVPNYGGNKRALLKWAYIFDKSMRPKDRSELPPIDYKFP